MMLTIPATGTDTFGFPIGKCGRCGGDGTYPSICWNGVCLDCNGSGRRYISKTTQNIALAFIHEFTEAGRVNGAHIEPGMRIRYYGSDAAAWHIVTAVQVTDEPCAWSTTTDADGTRHTTPTTYTRVVTFDDGATQTVHTEDWALYRDPEVWEPRRADAVQRAAVAETKAAARRARYAARKEAERLAGLAAREAEFIAWSAAHGELIAELAPYYRRPDYDPNPTRSRFLTELAQQIIGSRAPLSDDQIEGARKALAGLAATDRRRTESRHAGTVGAKVTVTGTITRRRSGDSGGVWGYWYLTVIEGTGDDEGITVTTFSKGEALLNLDEGDALTITGTVKEHTERDGFRETALSGRVKVVPVSQPAG